MFVCACLFVRVCVCDARVVRIVSALFSAKTVVQSSKFIILAKHTATSDACPNLLSTGDEFETIFRADGSISGYVVDFATIPARGTPYRVSGPLRVSRVATLNIEAGVTLTPDAWVGINVFGVLLMQGTPAQPVTITRSSEFAAGQFLGCFSSTDSYQSTSNYIFSYSMTPQRCVSICGDHMYPFAWLMSTYYCRCSADFNRTGSSQSCSSPCSGDSNQVCGGGRDVSVYATGVPRGWGSIHYPAYARSGRTSQLTNVVLRNGGQVGPFASPATLEFTGVAPDVTNVTITNSAGHGIYHGSAASGTEAVFKMSMVTVERSRGNGIHLENYACQYGCELDKVTLRNNEGRGLHMYMNSAFVAKTIKVTRSVFENNGLSSYYEANSRIDFAGAYFGYISPATILFDSNIVNNHTTSPDTIFSYYSAMTVSNCMFTNNGLLTSDYALNYFYSQYASYPQLITNCVFRGNKGGAIIRTFYYSSLIITNNTFVENNGTQALYVPNTNMPGYVYVRLSVVNNTFARNYVSDTVAMFEMQCCLNYGVLQEVSVF